MATQMAALRNLTHYRMGFRVAVAGLADDVRGSFRA